jgi:hypothetical protein
VVPAGEPMLEALLDRGAHVFSVSPRNFHRHHTLTCVAVDELECLRGWSSRSHGEPSSGE